MPVYDAIQHGIVLDALVALGFILAACFGGSMFVASAASVALGLPAERTMASFGVGSPRIVRASDILGVFELGSNVGGKVFNLHERTSQ